ncbi:MAG: hypothetical protein U0838_14785 [Chloroflexota bacterium]
MDPAVRRDRRGDHRAQERHASDIVTTLAPTLRGLLAEGPRLPIIAFDEAEAPDGEGVVRLTVEVAGQAEALAAAIRGTTSAIVVDGVGTFTVNRSPAPAGRRRRARRPGHGRSAGLRPGHCRGLAAQGARGVLADLNTKLAEAEPRGSRSSARRGARSRSRWT